MDPRFTSRKWMLTLFVVLLAIFARAMSWIDGAQFVSLLTWMVGLYFVGNVGQAAVDKMSITAQPAPAVVAPTISPS